MLDAAAVSQQDPVLGGARGHSQEVGEEGLYVALERKENIHCSTFYPSILSTHLESIIKLQLRLALIVVVGGDDLEADPDVDDAVTGGLEEPGVAEGGVAQEGGIPMARVTLTPGTQEPGAQEERWQHPGQHHCVSIPSGHTVFSVLTPLPGSVSVMHDTLTAWLQDTGTGQRRAPA